ncbi:hypothetical protein BROUX41_005906 [Berkeleyomyces rouxiae]|uniref:uncharacterized protein n=1 Tax=Berkeleyomyces rouxiae TaxID=2035830 RepID=UPI003B7AF362
MIHALRDAGSTASGAIKSASAGILDGARVILAASQVAYTWKILVLVPDRHDQLASLNDLASVARAAIPTGLDTLITQVGYTNFTILSAQERTSLGLDVNEQFDDLDFVHIGDVTLELMQALQHIIGANPQAEVALLSQGTGATAVSGLTCGPAPVQFVEPVHAKLKPLMDLTTFRRHVFADVRFSDRGHDTTWVNHEFSGVRPEQSRIGTGFASVTDTTGTSSQTSLFLAPFTNSSTPISDTIATTMQPFGVSGTAVGTPASLLVTASGPLVPPAVFSTVLGATSLAAGSVLPMTVDGR